MRFYQWVFILFYAVTVINYPRAGQVTTFECTSDVSREAAFYLYDLSARLLWKKEVSLQAGRTSQTGWDGYSDFNERAGNGIYLYRLIDLNSRKVIGKGKVWIINR